MHFAKRVKFVLLANFWHSLKLSGTDFGHQLLQFPLQNPFELINTFFRALQRLKTQKELSIAYSINRFSQA